MRRHDARVPLFLYLPFQAVHGPYDKVPFWPSSSAARQWSPLAVSGALPPVPLPNGTSSGAFFTLRYPEILLVQVLVTPPAREVQTLSTSTARRCW